MTKLLEALGVRVNVVAPLNASPADLARIPQAAFNIVLYPETALTAATWLERQFGQKFVLASHVSRLNWYSRSIDSTYLTGKRVFIFGDATHAIALARVAAEELGYTVVGLGTYAREFARELRAAAKLYDVEPLISDDYLAVEDAIKAARPELVLGTQMERHIAKRLGIPCAVISAPVHVQDFPARYSPFMGFEGANLLFDTLTHPMMMGLEEHLLGMFREDFEFGETAAPSHLAAAQVAAEPAGPASWDESAERELRKIPFFVRGKARRNTEKFAAEKQITVISVETLYDAKAYYSGAAA